MINVYIMYHKDTLRRYIKKKKEHRLLNDMELDLSNDFSCYSYVTLDKSFDIVNTNVLFIQMGNRKNKRRLLPWVDLGVP